MKMLMIFVLMMTSVFLSSMCLLANNMLKMILLVMSSFIFFWSFFTGWINYFLLLVYLGGFFILLFYLSTVSFTREKSFFLCFLIYLILGPVMATKYPYMTMSSEMSFILIPVVGSGSYFLVLGILLAGLAMLSNILPSGATVRGTL